MVDYRGSSQYCFCEMSLSLTEWITRDIKFQYRDDKYDNKANNLNIVGTTIQFSYEVIIVTYVFVINKIQE